MRRGRTHRALPLLAMATLLLLCAPLSAKVQIGVDIGWNNLFRAGKWTPLYVTLSDDSPRQVILEVYCPTDRRYAIRPMQSVAIGPQPVTIAMYVPLSFQVDETIVNVLDASTERRLAEAILSEYAAYAGQKPGSPEAIDTSNLLVGISGNAQSERLVESQLGGERVRCGFLPAARLPAVPIGYEELDLLVLNGPDLGRLGAEQQRAIADWVRSGGILVLWPGADPIPTAGPIAEILPCGIGQNHVFEIDSATLKRAALSDRFAHLKGRLLTNPTADAKPIMLWKSADPWGYRRWTGYGQVVLLGMDVSQLLFNSPDRAKDFWKSVLAGVVTFPEPNPTQTGNYYWQMNQNRAVPLGQVLDWLGDVPGAGQFGFSYVAGTLLALMVIVGPVDWFVLKRLGHQPWTWVTTAGWIGLVTLGAIYIGHIFKAGDLYFRTASVIDEASGMRVTSTDLIGIYSPQTRLYDVTSEPESWWRPASDTSNYGPGALNLEIACHQDYRGNRPLPMLINVWNLRYLEGLQIGPAAPMIEARLSRSGELLSGTITNRAPFALSGVRIRARGAIAKLDEAIQPGATVTVSAKLDRRDVSLATVPVNEQQARWQRYAASAMATSRPAMPILAALTDVRAGRVDEILRDRADMACVYAEFDAPPGDRAKLNEAGAKMSHAGLVRALVTLE